MVDKKIMQNFEIISKEKKTKFIKKTFFFHLLQNLDFIEYSILDRISRSDIVANSFNMDDGTFYSRINKKKKQKLCTINLTHMSI